MQYYEIFWRNTKPEDITKEYPARFKDQNQEHWVYGTLTSITRWKSVNNGDPTDTTNIIQWVDHHNNKWTQCQVYDAPAGFEIGDGWRLIDHKEDNPQAGDQYWSQYDKKWVDRSEKFTFKAGHIYRRRITPEPGEGYRYIDKTKDTQHPEDEYYCYDTKTWKIRENYRDTYKPLTYYRRKLTNEQPPQPINQAKTDYKQRVIAEQQNLAENIEKLKTFLYSERLQDMEVEYAEKKRLENQLWAMGIYNYILLERIANFK